MRLEKRAQSSALALVLAPVGAVAFTLLVSALLVLWAGHDDLEALHGDPLAVWRPWAGQRLQGRRLACGHHMAEEAPGPLAAELRSFLGS